MMQPTKSTQSFKPINQSKPILSLPPSPSLSQSKREGGGIEEEEGEEQNTAFSSTSSSSTRIAREGGG
jgi:hypothetical protein